MKLRNEIENLSQKATNTDIAVEALQFSQAALNLANSERAYTENSCLTGLTDTPDDCPKPIGISKLTDTGRYNNPPNAGIDIGRLSGDTTGRALRIIGDLMALDKPYSITLGKTYEDRMLIKRVSQLISQNNLDFFIFACGTITYDIWM